MLFLHIHAMKMSYPYVFPQKLIHRNYGSDIYESKPGKSLRLSVALVYNLVPTRGDTDVL